MNNRQEVAVSGEARPDYICVAGDQWHALQIALDAERRSKERLHLALLTAGHDLRQRLQIALGTAGLLARSPDSPRASDWLDTLSRHLRRVASDLAGLASDGHVGYYNERPATQVFSIRSIVNGVCGEWQPEAVRKHLLFACEQCDAVIVSDDKLLGVILNNLIANAVRHTIAGEVRIVFDTEYRSLVITIADSGPGISELALRNAFGASSAVDATDRGLGLGLSIVRRTADFLGHDVEIGTTPGMGTRIRLRVPLAAECRWKGPRDE